MRRVAIVIAAASLATLAATHMPTSTFAQAASCPAVRIGTYEAGEQGDVQGVWGYWDNAPDPDVCDGDVAYHFVRIDNGPWGGVSQVAFVEIGISVDQDHNRTIYTRCLRCSPQMGNVTAPGGVRQFWLWYDAVDSMWRWYLGDGSNNWSEVRHESSASVGMTIRTRVWAGGEATSTRSQLGVLFHNELAVYRYNGGVEDEDIYASQYRRFVPDDAAAYRSHCGNRYYTTYAGNGAGQQPGGEGSVSVSTNGSSTCGP